MKVGFQDPITGKPVMAEPADWERREAMLIIVVEVLREVGVEVNQSTLGDLRLDFEWVRIWRKRRDWWVNLRNDIFAMLLKRGAMVIVPVVLLLIYHGAVAAWWENR